jgi:hypothetical protein
LDFGAKERFRDGPLVHIDCFYRIGIVRLFQGRSRLKDGFVGLDGGVPLGTEGTPPFEDCSKRISEVLGVILAV